MSNLKVVLIKESQFVVSVSSPHLAGHFSTSTGIEPRKLAEAFLTMFATNPTEIVSDDGVGTAFYFTMETPNVEIS